jgi:hypothetical protein
MSMEELLGDRRRLQEIQCANQIVLQIAAMDDGV